MQKHSSLDEIIAAAKAGDPSRLALAADRLGELWQGEAEVAALAGGAYKLLGDERAGAWLTKALEAEPGSPRHGWNLAFWHLSRMEFERGFTLAAPVFQGWVREMHPNAAGLPFLNKGDPVSGRRVLALADGGIGDAIMWARWMKPLASLAGKAALMLSERCLRLSRLFEMNGIEIAQSADAYDCALPLGTIPWVLERHPVIAPKGYLKADPKRVAHWHERLPTSFAALSWRGSGTLENDPFRCRDIGLGDVLQKVPAGFAPVSVQQDLLPEEEGLGLLHEASSLDDKAAILSLAGECVLMDSALVHLAGALGCKGKLFLAFSPCWRWFGGLSPSPWYGGIETIRRLRPGL
jgi:hypothetical protein